MRKRNLFLVMLAMVLVCAISVTGTLAYLKMTTGDTPVTNTFLAAGGGELVVDPDGTEGTEYNGPVFTLTESTATLQDDGTYTLDTTKPTTTNSYDALPGVDLPKDPKITINKKTSAPAYLFVEVVDGLGTGSGITYSLTSDWKKLDGVTGANENGAVYVYTAGSTATPKIVDETFGTAGSGTVSILTENKVTVSQDLSITAANGITLKFYGYLGQASAYDSTTTDAWEKAADVYTNCFKNN